MRTRSPRRVLLGLAILLPGCAGTRQGQGSGGTATAPDALGDRILDALRDQGLISASDADSRRVTNTGATFAQLVEGYEFNLTANPTRNWRLQANFSYTDGYTSNVAPEVQAWPAVMIPYLK